MIIIKDKQLRTLVKSISWRVIASTATAIIVLILTGSFKLMIGAGIMDATSKFMIYYLHERIWNHVKWGKITT
ncbi:DUF2061 domain-containing protein [Candidatus Woesearchaeota archaeon]|nr:DUF2061 domain-containing protein [Candidatus Woesearchaeota archaeon]